MSRLPAQSAFSYDNEQAKRGRPWTDAHYEKVRVAAIAVVRTALITGTLKRDQQVVVDGPTLYALMGALDREPAP
jgi:hypothetical protein